MEHESLALRFAPEFYYKPALSLYEDVSPQDLGGLFWRSVENAAMKEVCIQYIVYFRQQHWIPGVFDKFSGKLPGSHPNDYVPLFLYFKENVLTRAVFDICHYEAVGEIPVPHRSLPQERPKFWIKNFYRGLAPLRDTKGYISLKTVPYPLSQKRLTEWWNGLTSTGSFDEKAKLIIRSKLEDPFGVITTFRDSKGKLGFFFDTIFRSTKDYTLRKPISPAEIKEKTGVDVSPDEIKVMKEFVEKNIVYEGAPYVVRGTEAHFF